MDMKNTANVSYSTRYKFPSKVTESVVCMKVLVSSQASIPLGGTSRKVLNVKWRYEPSCYTCSLQLTLQNLNMVGNISCDEAQCGEILHQDTDRTSPQT